METISGITKNPKSNPKAISMAVQRGNVQCVQGAYGESAFEELDEIFYIVKPNNILRFILTFLTWIKTYLMEIRIWKTFVASISMFMDTLFAVELEITPQQFIF